MKTVNIRPRHVFYKEIYRVLKYHTRGYPVDFHFNVRRRLFKFRVIDNLRNMLNRTVYKMRIGNEGTVGHCVVIVPTGGQDFLLGYSRKSNTGLRALRGLIDKCIRAIPSTLSTA